MGKVTKQSIKESFQHFIQRVTYWCKVTLWMTAFILVGISGYYIYSKSIIPKSIRFARQQATDTGRTLGFTLKEVLVEGRHYTDKQALLNCIDTKRGDGIFPIDIHRIRSKIEALPWINTAVIEKRLPDTLFITLQERVPLAYWQKNKVIYLIDDRGDIIPEKPKRLPNLPHVVGKDAAKACVPFILQLQQVPQLYDQVQSICHIGGRRWDIHFNNKIRVSLPEKKPEEMWQKLHALQEKHHLLDRDIKLVDLRNPDKVIIRTAEEKKTNPSLHKR